MNARDSMYALLDGMTPAVPRPKPAPCKCEARTFPHRPDAGCDKLALENEEAREAGIEHARDLASWAASSRG